MTKEMKFEKRILDAMNQVRQTTIELTSPFKENVGNIGVIPFIDVISTQSHSLVDKSLEAANFLESNNIKIIPASSTRREDVAVAVAKLG